MTDRLSFSHGAPSTSFYLEADWLSSDNGANTSLIRCYIRAVNDGTTASSSGGSGSHNGYLNGSLFRSHAAASNFLPSGYATGATRWREGPYDVTIGHDDTDGHGSFNVRQYVTDSVATDDQTSATIAVPRIPRAPGAPGTPTFGSITSTTATVSWTAALRGHADTTAYNLQVSTSSSFASFESAPVANVLSQAVTGLTKNVLHYVRVSATNADGTGSWSTVSTFTTPPDPPAAPTSVTVTRVSDTQQTVGWTRNATTAAPYASQNVRRRINGGSWATIASGLSGSATSYSDTTTTVNRKYEYQVQAVNTAGTATSTASAAVYTTPAAPTGATAAKDGSGNIVVTWSNNVAYTEYTTLIAESQNGGAYTLLATVPSGTATYTHGSPSTSVTHQYYVQAKTASGTVLYSGTSTTGTIVLSTNPNAPASLAPSGTPKDASAVIPFTWVHSSADTAPQSQFQIEHRLTGNAWTTVTAVTSSVSSWSLPAATYANGQTVEWHVRTWGTIGPGPYSATASFVTSTPPTVTISAPGATLNTSTVALSWAYYDAESTVQAAWTADLLDSAGAVLETKSGTNTAATTTFATAVSNSTSYSVRVKVQDGSGLWSTYATQAFTTSFLPPVNVTVTTTYDDGFGWVILTLVADAVVGGVTVAATSADLQRSLDGGVTWVTFATGLDPNYSIAVDSRAAINGTNSYRAIVYSALPSSRTTTTVTYVTTEVKWAYLSSGGGFGTVSRFYANMQLNPTFGRARTLHQFAGRSLPVEYDGEFLSESLAISALLDMSENTFDEFRTQAQTGGTVLWRDPTNRRLFGAISPIQGSQDRAQLGNISFTVSKTDFTE